MMCFARGGRRDYAEENYYTLRPLRVLCGELTFKPGQLSGPFLAICCNFVAVIDLANHQAYNYLFSQHKIAISHRDRLINSAAAFPAARKL